MCGLIVILHMDLLLDLCSFYPHALIHVSLKSEDLVSYVPIHHQSVQAISIEVLGGWFCMAVRYKAVLWCIISNGRDSGPPPTRTSTFTIDALDLSIHPSQRQGQHAQSVVLGILLTRFLLETLAATLCSSQRQLRSVTRLEHNHLADHILSVYPWHWCHWCLKISKHLVSSCQRSL